MKSEFVASCNTKNLRHWNHLVRIIISSSYFFPFLLGISLEFNSCSFLKCVQELLNIQDTIIRGLSDENLSVVQTALSIEGMAEVFSANSLLKAYQNVLSNCIDIMTKGIYPFFSLIFPNRPCMESAENTFSRLFESKLIFFTILPFSVA
jgi:hypothetical protein